MSGLAPGSKWQAVGSDGRELEATVIMSARHDCLTEAATGFQRLLDRRAQEEQ